MPDSRIFRDIRYFESDGGAFPGYNRRIFKLPDSINPLGARIACKLREYGYVAGAYHHLYVSYTPILPENQFAFSSRITEYWYKYVDYGLSPEKTNRLSEPEKEALVRDSTFSILKFISQNNQHMLEIINRVECEIHANGSELEILHKQKETASYLALVTYQIRPKGKQSVGFIEYFDKKAKKIFKTEFVKLNSAEDIFFLVGSISVSQGYIVLKPRPSFRSSLYTNQYKSPIRIKITFQDAE